MTIRSAASRQARAIASCALLCCAIVALFMLDPIGSNAKSASQLQSSIAGKQAKSSALNGQIDSMGTKISGLRGRIAVLQKKQNAIQADLDVKAARQKRIGDQLKQSAQRLAKLRAQLAHGRKVLAARIVTMYKQGEPGMLEVILNSDGFSDLVDRATYMSKIAAQDRVVIATVTKLRSSTKRETVKLASLNREASQLVAQVRTRRDAVAGDKGSLAAQRNQLSRAVHSRKTKLAVVAKSLRHDQEDLAAMQQSSSAVAGYLNGAAPKKKGTGQLIKPADGPYTSPFGMRWGRMHEGVDIGVPTGTPVHAADTGTVRYAGWMEGYGNYTCIQHTSSLSTCYGHQSVIKVHVGQSVTQGQLIGLSGNTGHSTGPHLHFEVRINGAAVDPMGYL